MAQSVPAWEKEFCLKVGLFQWEEFVEAKKYIHEYQCIMVWDDSASKEAFNNAKERFKARSFALPCMPPTPNACIDEVIDWNPKIDPKLHFGLEVCPEDLVYSNPENENESENKNKNKNNIGAKDRNSSWKICQIKNWRYWLLQIACCMFASRRKLCM